jgi:hypothetical protein
MMRNLTIGALALSAFLQLSCNRDRQESESLPGGNSTTAAGRSQTTYCNPIDIDYTYMSHYRAERDVSYRSGADPAVVNFRGKYYMFVTRSHGYWVSEDMGHWRFIRPQSWYFSGSNAPAAAVRGDRILAYGDPSGRGDPSSRPTTPSWVTGRPTMRC